MTCSLWPLRVPAPLWLLAFLLAFSMTGNSFAAGGTIFYTRYTDILIGPKTFITVSFLHKMNSDGAGDVKITTGLADPRDPTWSRDGKFVALTSRLPPLSASYQTLNASVFNPATGAVKQITPWFSTFDPPACVNECTEYCTQVYSKAFSSDGRRLAVVSMKSAVDWLLPPGSTLWESGYHESYPFLEVYDTKGEHAKVVVGKESATSSSMHQGDGLDWTPDEDLLIYPLQMTTDASPVTALVAVAPVEGAVDAGNFRQLTTPQFFTYRGNYGVGVCYEQDFQPAVGPVSKRIVYVRERDCIDGGHPVSPSTISVRMVNLNGTGDRAIYAVPRGKYVSHVSWAPDESKLVLSCGDQLVNDLNAWLDNYSVRIALLNPDGAGFRQIGGKRNDYPAWKPLGPRTPRGAKVSVSNAAPEEGDSAIANGAAGNPQQ